MSLTAWLQVSLFSHSPMAEWWTNTMGSRSGRGLEGSVGGLAPQSSLDNMVGQLPTTRGAHGRSDWSEPWWWWAMLLQNMVERGAIQRIEYSANSRICQSILFHKFCVNCHSNKICGNSGISLSYKLLNLEFFVYFVLNLLFSKILN